MNCGTGTTTTKAFATLTSPGLDNDVKIEAVEVGDAYNPLYLLIAAYAVRRLPYVVRAAVAGLQQSNITLEEAARSLGATPLRRTNAKQATMMVMIVIKLSGSAVISRHFRCQGEVSDSDGVFCQPKS